MKNSDMPAMPSKAEISNTDEAFAYQLDHGSKFQFPGLTKREMFAMHAMHGLISSDYKNGSEKMNSEDVALMSVDYADALLAELERTK